MAHLLTFPYEMCTMYVVNVFDFTTCPTHLSLTMLWRLTQDEAYLAQIFHLHWQLNGAFRMNLRGWPVPTDKDHLSVIKFLLDDWKPDLTRHGSLAQLLSL